MSMSDKSEERDLYARNSSFEILLFKAARDGDVKQCKELISRGVETDITNKRPQFHNDIAEEQSNCVLGWYLN